MPAPISWPSSSLAILAHHSFDIVNFTSLSFTWLIVNSLDKLANSVKRLSSVKLIIYPINLTFLSGFEGVLYQ